MHERDARCAIVCEHRGSGAGLGSLFDQSEITWVRCGGLFCRLCEVKFLVLEVSGVWR